MMGAILALFLSIPAGCGGDGSPAESSAGRVSEERVCIPVIDSIGIDLGDSNYVFANIMALEHGPDGNIYVLDRGTFSVAVYSPDGEFISRIGSPGSGPGELSMPLAMAVLGDGRIAICDPVHSGINTYFPNGEWEGLSAEFNNNPPMSMVGVDSNAFVAFKLTVEFDEVLTTTFTVGRYEEDEEPSVYYYEDEFPFDPQNLTDLLNRTFFSINFTADREGNVYTIPMSTEDYLVEVFDSEGSLILEISRDMERVEKSEGEILEEKEWIETWLRSMGAGGVVIEYDPLPYRYMTSDIGYDAQDRIWVRRGTELIPVFDVYDMDGVHLFTAEVEGVGEDAQFWDFIIDDYGMMAYSLNPEYFHKIWLMELPQ